MTTAADRANAVRRSLAKKLVELRLRHRKVFDDMDGLKASLIANAQKAGDGFRELFEGKGQISVACPKAKEFRGDLPEVDPVAFHALPDAKRQKLIDDGVIKLVPNWSRDFHGRVEIKLF